MTLQTKEKFKMKKITVLIFLVALSVLMTACVSNPVLEPKYSDALNIIRTEYPGIKSLSDTSYKEFLKSKGECRHRIGNYDDLSLTDSAALGLKGGLAGMLDNLGADPAKQSHFLIWMPADGQVDKKAAGNKIYDMLRGNITRAVRTVYGKDWNIQVEQTFLPNKKYDAQKFSPIRLSGEGGEFYLLFHSSFGIYKPKIATAPDFLSRNKSYYWNYGGNNFYVSLHTRQEYECIINHQGYHKECRKIADPGLQPDLRLYREISRNMPCWFFAYVAPKKTCWDGKLYDNPVVFNRGKAYYFIEPSPEKKKNLDGRLINGVCRN